MKSSIKYFLVLILTSVVTSSYGQKKDSTMIVNGVCDMCRFTIENAAYIDGVENAEWDVETKVLKLTYDLSKSNLKLINASINKAGYDTEFHTGDDEAYEKLHACCHYRDPEVVKEHEDK